MHNKLELGAPKKAESILTLKNVLAKNATIRKTPELSNSSQKEIGEKTVNSPEITPQKSVEVKSTHELPLAGGHHEHFKLTSDGKGIIKQTSKAEIDFYKLHMNGNTEFSKIIPKCFEVNEKEGTVTLENLTYNMKNPSVIDIKIGTHSFSGIKKPGLIGIKEAIVRGIKWNYRDIKQGLRERGWKVQGGSWIKGKTKPEISEHSHEYIDDFIKRNNLSKEQLQNISDKLKEIGQIMKDSNYGITNASIMIAVDDNTEPRVKYIDFAHVIEFKNQLHKKLSHHNKGSVKGSFGLAELFKAKAK